MSTSLVKGWGRWPSIWDDDFFDLTPTVQATNGLDVYETDQDIVVKANVAGVPTDDIDITFEKGQLFITAQSKTETKDEKKRSYAQSSWSYSYRVSVPGELDQNAEPSVELDNGVLNIKFKKAAIAQPKKLQIKAK